jgi:hypothetical protein
MPHAASGAGPGLSRGGSVTQLNEAGNGTGNGLKRRRPWRQAARCGRPGTNVGLAGSVRAESIRKNHWHILLDRGSVTVVSVPATVTDQVPLLCDTGSGGKLENNYILS